MKKLFNFIIFFYFFSFAFAERLEKIHLLKDKVSQGFNQMIKEENLNKEQIKLYSKELHKDNDQCG